MEAENKPVDDFLQEIASISHKDSRGTSVIEAYDEANIDWLMSAYVDKNISPAYGLDEKKSM